MSEWKPVKDFEGFYEVSDQVRSRALSAKYITCTASQERTA